MLKSLKQIFKAAEVPSAERHQVRLAVAVLLHEARRADSQEGGDESEAGARALIDLFAMGREEATHLLAQGQERAQQLTSFYAPLAAIKREFSQEQRVRLIEHLWRVSFADGQLNLYEDHYVRKIAHLLYVPNTQSMLARNRARSS